MENKNLQKEPKKQVPAGSEKKSANELNVDKLDSPLKNDSDAGPEDLISPNADTDQPMDGHVVNDAVLYGESHADSKVENIPDSKIPQKPAKTDKGKL